VQLQQPAQVQPAPSNTPLVAGELQHSQP
jgi:hypothetical protein